MVDPSLATSQSKPTALDIALDWFVKIWVGLVVLANILGIIGMFVTADSFWDGWKRVTEIYSPFNVINWIAQVVSLLPAIGAHMWLEKRRRRASQRPPVPRC